MRERTFSIWSLLALGLVLLFSGTIDLPLLDRDEPRFSRATVEMMESGNWVVPYFNGEYRFDKPPLTYWLMSVGYRLFGYSEIGARLHSILATLLSAGLLFYISLKWYGRRAALYACLGWLTCLQVMIHGRLALADMALTACIIASHLACIKILKVGDASSAELNARSYWIWFAVLYLSLALGFLAKGPLSIIIPFLTLVIHRWLFRSKEIDFWRLKPWLGFPVSIIIIASWGIPALMKTQGAYWDTGMGYHVIERGMGAFNKRMHIPGIYYLLTSALSFFPWFFFLLSQLRNLRREWNEKISFLASWGLSSYLVFTFYATQLPHYILPSMPALLILAFRNGLPGSYSKLHVRFMTVVASLMFIFAGAVFMFSEGFHLTPVGELTVLLALALGSLAGFSVVVARKYVIASTVFLAVFAVSIWGFGFESRKVAVVRNVGLEVAGVPAELRVVGVNFSEPGLVFYGDRIWEFALEEDLPELMNDPTVGAIVALKNEYRFEKCLFRDPDSPFRSFSYDTENLTSDPEFIKTEKEGLNFARPSWAEVEIWKRQTSLSSLNISEER